MLRRSSRQDHVRQFCHPKQAVWPFILGSHSGSVIIFLVTLPARKDSVGYLDIFIYWDSAKKLANHTGPVLDMLAPEVYLLVT